MRSALRVQPAIYELLRWPCRCCWSRLSFASSSLLISRTSFISRSGSFSSAAIRVVSGILAVVVFVILVYRMKRKAPR